MMKIMQISGKIIDDSKSTESIMSKLGQNR